MNRLLPVLLVSFACFGCAPEDPFHAEYRDHIAKAESDDERLYWEFAYRLKRVVAEEEVEDLVVISDGVDQFEAWVMARLYLSETQGVCSDIALPVKDGRVWMIPTWVGRRGRESAPIYVDSISGRVRCDGYPAIEDPTAYLQALYDEEKGT